jgi:hypothetical protein
MTQASEGLATDCLTLVCAALCVLFQITPLSSLVFAAVMGLCWLTTVPLTNALLASIYGGKHMSMVSGVAFFFHQVGTALHFHWLTHHSLA